MCFDQVHAGRTGKAGKEQKLQGSFIDPDFSIFRSETSIMFAKVTAWIQFWCICYPGALLELRL